MTISTNGHFTNDEFTELLISGALSEERRSHLSQCDRCRQDAEDFTLSVGIFNTTSLAWSETRPKKSLRATARSQVRRALYFPVAWALAAALFILVGIPVWNHSHQLAFSHQARTTSAPDDSADIAQDNELLQSVNVALNTEDASPLPEYRLYDRPRKATHVDARTR